MSHRPNLGPPPGGASAGDGRPSDQGPARAAPLRGDLGAGRRRRPRVGPETARPPTPRHHGRRLPARHGRRSGTGRDRAREGEGVGPAGRHGPIKGAADPIPRWPRRFLRSGSVKGCCRRRLAGAPDRCQAGRVVPLSRPRGALHPNWRIRAWTAPLGRVRLAPARAAAPQQYSVSCRLCCVP